MNRDDEVPPKIGESPIPEGHVRLFHHTWSRHIPSIREHGLLAEMGQGDSGKGYGNEPSAGVWAATQHEPPRAEAERSVVEFHVHPSEIAVNGPNHGRDLAEWNSGDHNVLLHGSVKPENIVAIHDPWHTAYHQMSEDRGMREQTLSGHYDNIGEDPQYAHSYGRAIHKIKSEGAKKEDPKTFFHGTTVELKPGDIVRPGKETGTRTHPHLPHWRDEHVWATPDEVGAWDYAGQSENRHGDHNVYGPTVGTQPRPRVYEVEPLGPVQTRRPLSPFDPEEYTMPAARVVRSIDIPHPDVPSSSQGHPRDDNMQGRLPGEKSWQNWKTLEPDAKDISEHLELSQRRHPEAWAEGDPQSNEKHPPVDENQQRFFGSVEACLMYLAKRENPMRFRNRNKIESAIRLLEESGYDVSQTMREAARRIVAHDSGDGATIYHCPFCGSGQVTARSDGTVECSYCHSFYTVQVQPEFPSMPQTDPATGMPMQMPGMPGSPGGEAGADDSVPDDPDSFAPPGADDADPSQGGDPDAFVPPDGSDSGGGDDSDDDNTPPWLKKSMRTADGTEMPMSSYIKRLAIHHADNPAAVLERIREENGVNA